MPRQNMAFLPPSVSTGRTDRDTSKRRNWDRDLFTALMTTDSWSSRRPRLQRLPTTTIDASTSAPTAIAMPPCDMMLAERPNARNGMNAISTAIGIVKTGTIALGMCHRNSRITAATVIMISTSVHFRLSTARLIRSERS
jgi:hypothetical protein